MISKLSRISAIAACVTTALAVALPGRATTTPPPASIPAGCTGDPAQVIEFSMTVDGGTAEGRYALPSSTPVGLVVFAHGYSHTTASWRAHMTNAANHGLVAVGMDYRGTQVLSTNPDGSESARGWPARKGAADTIAAGQLFSTACPFIETVVAFGVSMGGNMSGLAVAQAGGLFDYWFDVEGAANVIETYNEARAVGPFNAFAAMAEEDIRNENGGKTFEQDPTAYVEITVAPKAGEMKAGELKGAVVIHGVDDGLVPYNQSREMVAALRAVGIPTEDITVGERDEQSESGTTISGIFGLDPGLTGHASEKSTTHIIMRTSLARLFSLFENNPPSNRTVVSNDELPSFGFDG